MKIKTKISAALGFLFLVIVSIGSVAVIYINRIANESKGILKDNYESVQLVKAMMQDLDAFGADTTKLIQRLETKLHLQEKNITEPGEKELTRDLGNLLDSAKTNGFAPHRITRMKSLLYRITETNLQAIQRKNDLVQNKAGNVLTYIGVIGAFCFVIVFTFIINFPGYIANPVKKLTAGIKRISERNYDERLDVSSGDEFGELARSFNTMAERLQQYESSNLAQIMSEKQRIETIINNMSDAIIGLNEKRMVLFANSPAVELIGLTQEEMLGKYVPNLAVNNETLKLLMNEQNLNAPLCFVRGGKENYFQKEHIVISSGQHPLGEVILLKNITRYEEQDQAKTSFIATVSHELKTPIASIKLSSKLLEDKRVGELNEEQQQLVSNIKEDTERLLKMTVELLNMTQAEAGKVQLNIQKVHPKEIVEPALESLRFQATQKNIKVEVDCSEELSLVNADPEKTTWVLVNLIGNAIRYSPEGQSIWIKVSGKGNRVVFSVKDEGPGIEPRYQKKIFEKYFRVPGAKKEGTGLGLAISKEFIDAQKGLIYVESKPGNGSTFFFELEKAV